MENQFRTLWLRRIALLLILSFSCSGLTGCWDYDEIDETGYVLFLGLDRGVENRLTLTAQIAVPGRISSNGAGGGGGSDTPIKGQAFQVVSVEAPTFTGAFNMMISFVDRRLSLKHTKSVIFSEELAREGIMTYLSVMARFPEFRRSVFISVTRKNSAKEYLEKLTPTLEANPAKNSELAAGAANFLGSIPAEPYFHYFYNDAKSTDSDPTCFLADLQRLIPQGAGPSVNPDEWIGEGSYYPGELPRSGGNPREFIGGAVFRDDRMVGEINGNEMTALKLIRGTMKTFTLSVPDPLMPDKMIGVNLQIRKPPQKQIDLNGSVPRLHITVYLEGSLIGMQSSGISYENPNNRQLVEETINQQLNEYMETLVDRAQHEFQADILHLGKTVKHQFRTQQEWVAYDWLNTRFPQAEITVEARTKLRRFGLLRKNAPLSREVSS